MKYKQLVSVPIIVFFLALAPTALASNTWYVDGVHGSDADNCQTALTACKTIGHAISRASSGASIIVAAATYTENLTIPFSLNVIGSSANTTIIDGGGVSRVITIKFGVVTLSHVTIRNGRAVSGGGILNEGLLTINQSTVAGNLALWERTVGYSYGGGIYTNSNATLTINNSTVSGNSASVACGEVLCAGFGGGIYNNGELFVNNSTLVGNSAAAHFAPGQGGAIENHSGIVRVSNSTIVGNSAARGGGIFGPVSGIQNSIVANSGANCDGTVSSKGYNLSSDNTCNFNGPGDRNNTDPKLGTFGYNGGPTQTIPLLSGSPAIDAGNPNGCTDTQGNLLKTDQRGLPRHDPEDTGGCDIGAYERQSD